MMTFKFKPGQRVNHDALGVGKITDLAPRANGMWLLVDFGDKKKPNHKMVRPATVTKA